MEASEFAQLLYALSFEQREMIIRYLENLRDSGCSELPPAVCERGEKQTIQ